METKIVETNTIPESRGYFARGKNNILLKAFQDMPKGKTLKIKVGSRLEATQLYKKFQRKGITVTTRIENNEFYVYATKDK